MIQRFEILISIDGSLKCKLLIYMNFNLFSIFNGLRLFRNQSNMIIYSENSKILRILIQTKNNPVYPKNPLNPVQKL